MKIAVRPQQGFALVEVLVAVLLFSIGILAVVGMQAFSIGAVTDAKYRADASFLANQAIGRLWGDPTNLASQAESDVSVPELPNGKRTIGINGQQAVVTIRWEAPPGEEHEFSATAHIHIAN